MKVRDGFVHFMVAFQTSLEAYKGLYTVIKEQTVLSPLLEKDAEDTSSISASVLVVATRCPWAAGSACVPLGSTA